MVAASKDILAGEGIETALDKARARVAAAGFAIDYIDVRDATNLSVVEKYEGRPLRMLAAARLGKTRLIDNIAVG